MKALVFGCTGMDGSYIAELLLAKGYEVHGTYRRNSTPNFTRIAHILGSITLHRCDLTDTTSVRNVINKVEPHEIYNEADQDHVGWSYDLPEYSLDVTAGGPVRILHAVADNPMLRNMTRIFQPCSSHMYGQAETYPQNERTPFHPVSPYGCAKVYAYHTARYYRNVHGIHVSVGILYNHESPRRSTEYVTRKITHAAAHGERVTLGNVEAEIDWGYAPDFMQAAHSMLQRPDPDDYVIATGELHSVAEVLEIAYGDGWEDMYTVSDEFYRPADTSVLVGNSLKAREVLAWQPTISFREMIQEMVLEDQLW
jgi:GDPmannose 4,6-dehydratase